MPARVSQNCGAAPGRGLIPYGVPGAPARRARQPTRGRSAWGHAMDFKARHNVIEWGPLAAELQPGAVSGEALESVADLVCNLADSRCLPLSTAAGQVLDALAAGGVPLYTTRRAQFAMPVTDACVWREGKDARSAGVRIMVPVRGANPYQWTEKVPARAAVPELRGVAGAIALARESWAVRPLSQAKDLHASDPLRRLAVLASDARQLFPELFGLPEAKPATAPVEGLPAGLHVAEVVQPEGGQWPHVDGQAWTEGERVALFLMRHRDKRTGAQLEGIAGVTRQRIDELIGLARPYGGLSAAVAKDGWRPTAALLAACGQPLQPLQSVALAMAS